MRSYLKLAVNMNLISYQIHVLRYTKNKKDHGDIYMKVRLPLVCHLQCSCLLILDGVGGGGQEAEQKKMIQEAEQKKNDTYLLSIV